MSTSLHSSLHHMPSVTTSHHQSLPTSSNHCQSNRIQAAMTAQGNKSTVSCCSCSNQVLLSDCHRSCMYPLVLLQVSASKCTAVAVREGRGSPSWRTSPGLQLTTGRGAATMCWMSCSGHRLVCWAGRCPQMIRLEGCWAWHRMMGEKPTWQLLCTEVSHG